MSAFLGLTDAVVTVLSAATALADGHIRRGRGVPVPTAWSSAIDVHVQRSTADVAYLTGALMVWDTLIGIDVYARAAAGTDGEAAIDTLLAAVFTRMSAATPPTGALAWTFDPVIQWDVSEADQTVAQASLVLRVRHYTSTDLSASAG